MMPTAQSITELYGVVDSARGPYETIRDGILSGRRKPGDRLIERKLAEELGVGRLAVREALRSLAADGLVETIPHIGSFVRKLTGQDALDILDVRRGIESTAALLAAERATPEEVEELRALADRVEECDAQGDFSAIRDAELAFHRFVVRLSANREIENICHNVRAIYGSLWDGPRERDGESLRDPRRHAGPRVTHKDVADAIASGDSMAAFTAMWEHFDGTVKFLREQVERG